MASSGVNFKRFLTPNVSTAARNLLGSYTVPNHSDCTAMVLSIVVSNTSENEIFINLVLKTRDETDNIVSCYIAKSIPIPVASTTIYGSELKLILEPGDSIEGYLDNGVSATIGDSAATSAIGTADIIVNISEMA